MSTPAPNGDQPWITARVVAATEFCPRAGIIAYEDKQGDIGEEHDSGPRLDYLPDFSLEMLAASLQATVNSVWLGLTWAPPVLLVVGIAGYVSNSTILLVLIPVAYFGGRWLIQKLRNVAELSRRLRAAQDAVPSEPSAESTELQPVNWWSLLKAGFSSVEYEDAHEDPALRFSGKPWRVLHKGSLRIPVFRKRAGKPELHQQQLARMAAYCHLIVQAEGSHSPYGIVLFGDGYDGVTVPFTRENRELFLRTLSRARELFAAIAANGSLPDMPHSMCCRDCPLGRPRVHVLGMTSDSVSGTSPPPYRTRGTDKKVYHSPCGDRYQWVPPHVAAKEKGLC